jgi:hypothetical protein
MTSATASRAAGPAAPTWPKRFGYRNIAYLASIPLLIVLAVTLEASGAQGPDARGAGGAAVLIWGIGSTVFFLVNAVLAIIALVRGQPAAKPAIACAMPLGLVLLTLLFLEIMEATERF